MSEKRGIISKTGIFGVCYLVIPTSVVELMIFFATGAAAFGISDICAQVMKNFTLRLILLNRQTIDHLLHHPQVVSPFV